MSRRSGRGRIRALAWGGLLCAAAALGQGGVATAHPGHGPHDGRLASKPDFERVGRETRRYDASVGGYRIERAGRPPMYFHVDERANAGAPYPLPTQEDAPVCATSGHRIVVVWHRSATDATPGGGDVIRSIVRRMNWKIKAQAETSSGGSRPLQMKVDCIGGQIAVHEVVSASNADPDVIRDEVHGQLGDPRGAGSVKYLVFRDGPAGGAAGVGYLWRDATKSASDTAATANSNRYYSSSAITWQPYWERHTPIHELVHAMGGAQPGAPLATAGFHCVDGHDLLCYDDARAGEPPVGYNETYCPTNGVYETPAGVPLDCNYDTYFDARTEAGEWLESNWNLGGYENPFLVEEDGGPSIGWHQRHRTTGGPDENAFVYGTASVQDREVLGDWDGDGVDTVGVFAPGTSTWYLRNDNSAGVANLAFVYGTGSPDAVPVVGDWDGDGVDTVGVFIPSTNTWYLRNSNSAGVANLAFVYGTGSPDAVPVVGDWDGDGVDTVGVFAPSTNTWYLRNSNTAGVANLAFAYGTGSPDAVPVAGDWDGDGDDTVGVRDPQTRTWYLRNANSAGPSAAPFAFGGAGAGVEAVAGDVDGDGADTVATFQPSTSSWRQRLTNAFSSFRFRHQGEVTVVGDWNGDGIATPGTYDPDSGHWRLRNSNSQGAPDAEFLLGPLNGGGQPVVGDWNGDGIDTVALFDQRTSTWWQRATNAETSTVSRFAYGTLSAADRAVAGDWDGNGTSTVGVYNQDTGTWWLRNANSAGVANISFRFFASGGDLPIAGDWDGDGIDTTGLLNPSSAGWHLRNANTSGGGDVNFTFDSGGSGGDRPLAGDWDGDGVDTTAASSAG